MKKKNEMAAASAHWRLAYPRATRIRGCSAGSDLTSVSPIAVFGNMFKNLIEYTVTYIVP